jgi:hypothetical protein
VWPAVGCRNAGSKLSEQLRIIRRKGEGRKRRHSNRPLKESIYPKEEFSGKPKEKLAKPERPGRVQNTPLKNGSKNCFPKPLSEVLTAFKKELYSKRTSQQEKYLNG